MQIQFCNSNDKAYQKRLNALLAQAFFDFSFWFDLGLWDERYESYSIEADHKIVSNACVYKAMLLRDGAQTEALSFGAVATLPAYRGRGYARALMEHIIEKYDTMPMYLEANVSVLDFYPRFGFRQVKRKRPAVLREVDNANSPQRLAHTDGRVKDYIYNHCNYSNKFDCMETQSINMFHLYAGDMRDAIYEIPELETMVVAKQDGRTLHLSGVFSKREIGFSDLIMHLPFMGVKRITLGFMPCWDDVVYAFEEYDQDPFFARGVLCRQDFIFPEMSLT